MLIYYIVWLIFIIPYVSIDRRKWKYFNRNYALFVFVCLLILMGFRHITVGTDTKQYAYLYSLSSEFINPDKYDRGYYLFADFFHRLGLSFYAYNFVVAFILTGALVLFYAIYSKNLAFSSLMFMTIGLLPMYMSGTRQSLAISFVLVAMLWVDKHKGILHVLIACCIIWIANTFHASAIIGFVAVAIIALRIRLSRTSVFLLVCISAASLVYRNYLAAIASIFLPEKYMEYDLSANYYINPLLIMIAILIPVFCAIFDTTVDRDGKYSCEKTWMYFFTCANMILTILAPNSMYFSRLAYYFVHVNSILVPNVIVGQKLRNNAIIMYLAIGILCVLFFIISIPGGTLGIDEYIFFWQYQTA